MRARELKRIGQPTKPCIQCGREMYASRRQGVACRRCRVSASVERRFGWYVTPGGLFDCWLWRGAVGSDGYGLFMVKRQTIRAHRFALMCEIGAFAGQACHTCDTPLCVNPAHLWVGTHKENHADCTRKGRRQSGERHWNTRLTDDVVAYLRLRVESRRVAAAKFGVAPSTVKGIRTYRSRKHATGA
jgi:hypothetical protein